MYSDMGFPEDNGFYGEGKMILEAAEVLLVQLQKLRAKKMALKKKRKEEKANLRAAQMKARDDSGSSSSSSSESSDSEYEQVINMRGLRISTALAEPEAAIEEEASVTSPSLRIEEHMNVEGYEDHGSSSFGLESCSRNSISFIIGDGTRAIEGASAQRIEVCMGGKCKKSGAVALLEEFERRVGVEGAVVGCKCMGKCRDGPNVRVLDHCNKNSLMEYWKEL